MTGETELKLLEIIAELKAEVEALKKEVADIRHSQNPFSHIKINPLPFQMPLPLYAKKQFQDLCTDGSAHDYPLVWAGTTPPPCNKCQMVPSNPTVVSSSTVVIRSGAI